MRPGQNKRMRGRNNNNNNGSRKGPNPLTRSFESNGPDVKIRGTAHHVGEKYLQLARDAQSSGDPVMAESYLQHAEHYFRVIAAAQQAQQQAAFGYQRPAGEQAEPDDDGDEDFDAVPDRFASPAERVQTPAPQPVAQPYAERQPYNNGGQPFEQRQDRHQNQQSQPSDRPQADRPQQDRSYDNRNGRGERNGYQDRSYQNRNGQERGGQERGQQERNGQDRGQDRPVYDRDANQDRNQDRGNQDRGAADRGNQDRPRDYDNRGFRNNRGPREMRDNNQAREPRQPVVEEPTNGLPAFITAPTRVPVEAVANQPAADVSDAVTSPETTDDAFHLRPRRRRRPKAEFAGSEGESPTSDPVNE